MLARLLAAAAVTLIALTAHSAPGSPGRMTPEEANLIADNPTTPTGPAALLVPAPKSAIAGEGTFAMASVTGIIVPDGIEEPEILAARELAQVIAKAADLAPPRVVHGTTATAATDNGIHLAVAPDERKKSRDGYTLEVTTKGIVATGNSAHGLLNAIRTLTQYVAIHGATLPAISITDEPDFATRGFYHDVTRGKIPHRETLYFLIDFLARHKVNHLQLYVEHPFDFAFDPSIAHTPDALTAEDIQELDRYCRLRRIEFVPSLQAFGHMAGVLSLPQYRHLAAVEMEHNWPHLSWYQRMHGATIDCTNPDALALLRRMIDEYLPLFPAPYYNACADETYDLGRGKTSVEADRITTGRLYLQHISWLRDASVAHGKRLMIWGDIVKKYPDLIPEIPKDIILLNWGYSATTDFESCALFADAGLEFFVCPGTSGWNRILNDLNTADLNIRRYASAGKRHGATGLLNTDWGDHGHFNPIAGSLHGAMLGAAMAWNTSSPDRNTFDRAFDLALFGDADAGAAANLRAQSLGASTWQVLYHQYIGKSQLREWVARATPDAAKLRDAAAEGEALFSRLRPTALQPSLADQLRLGSQFNTLLADKIAIAATLRTAADETTLSLIESVNAFPVENLGADARATLAAELREWAASAHSLLREFEVQWRQANRESGLQDIRHQLQERMAEAIHLATRLEGSPVPAPVAAANTGDGQRHQ